jgi:hypothetical protein
MEFIEGELLSNGLLLGYIKLESCHIFYFWVSWLQEEFSLQGADGILVPGGFGDRGVEGKILAAKYAREKNVPYLGICLGMQIAVVEYARHVMNFTDANSTEFDPNTKTPCVIFMPEVIANGLELFWIRFDTDLFRWQLAIFYGWYRLSWNLILL